MSCRSSVELMSLRLDGLLDGSAWNELERHLATCTRCRGDWANFQEADTTLRLTAHKPVTPPSDFVMKVMIRVAATPVVRPALWDRVRLEGGRRTMPLQTAGRRPTMPLPRTAPLAVPTLAPAGPRGVLAHLQTRWVQAYLGVLGGASALAVLLLVVVATALAVGGTSAQTYVDGLPGGPLFSPLLGGARTELLAFWHLLVAWVSQIDLLLVGALGLGALGCAALWLYVVGVVLRRAGSGRIEA